ncbi:hypothetical protein BC835DRAFT_1488254 [Cytidiella melzeri]|nr:hypothetical protein BC835DRAFT_1488254 [Cytidiella melzeri]
MSNSDGVAVDWFLLEDNYAILASGVLWTLDYLDTLPMEIQFFWSLSAKVSLTTVLFFVGRYLYPIYAYIRIWDLLRGTVTDSMCAHVSFPGTVFLEVATMCTSTLLLLRAYALCSQNRLVLALGLVLILGRCAFGSYINLALEVPVAGDGEPFAPRCTWIRPNDSNDQLFQNAACYSDFGVGTGFVGQQGVSGLIVRDVLHDGDINSVVLLLAACTTAANLAVITGKGSNALNSLGQIIVPFFNTVPNILASRLVLSARNYGHLELSSAPTLGLISMQQNNQEARTLRELRFARFLGSIGAPLRSGSDANEDEVELPVDVELPHTRAGDCYDHNS